MEDNRECLNLIYVCNGMDCYKHVMLDCIIIDDCEQLYDHQHKDVVSTAVTVI